MHPCVTRMWSYVGKSAIFVSGCCTGAACATFLRAEERKQQLRAGEYYQLKGAQSSWALAGCPRAVAGSYYQVLGHAWAPRQRHIGSKMAC